MSKFRTWQGTLIVLLLLAGYYILTTGAWTATERYTIWQDTLTITAANGRDSTAVFPCDREVTIAILPGYTTSTPDSYSANKDSSDVDIFFRGFSDRSRSAFLGQIQLFNPFQLQTFAKASNYDSGAMSINFSGTALAAYTAGTGSWDSTRVDLVHLKNIAVPEIWPYCDIEIYDADTQTGKGAKYIIKYIGYTSGVSP